MKKYKSVPKGFYLARGATTAPRGYRLYTSRKPTESRFTKKKHTFVLVKEKKK